MTNFKNILAALAIVAISSSVATAQTDFGGGTGAGAGAGGAFAPFAPGLRGLGTAPGLTGNGARGLAVARSQFASATGPTLLVSAGGGNATLSPAFLQALAGVLGGAPSPAQSSAVADGLTGVPGGTATALVTALQTLGARTNVSTLRSAVTAYNAAVDALPTGTNPPAGLAAIRIALFRAGAY